jgi:hypothetical protein
MLGVLCAVIILYGWMYITVSRVAVLPSFVLGVMAAVVFILASFGTLTVSVDEQFVAIKFGYGIFRKRFQLNEIASATKVKNHWYYGWGIKLWFWPYMQIYNVSGFDAVELVMKNGKIYRIGTDAPEELERAINMVLK